MFLLSSGVKKKEEKNLILISSKFSLKLFFIFDFWKKENTLRKKVERHSADGHWIELVNVFSWKKMIKKD